MKSLSIFYVAFLFITINVNAQISEDSISLESSTGIIRGTLLLPEKSEKVPLVIMIAGSGPTDRDGNNPMMKNNSLKMLAHGLGENGIASLRYDKRGIGESKNAGITEKDLRFEHYVEDVKSWIELLNVDKRFSKLIIIGHSEGSLIGMIASNTQKVDAFISLAGVGRPAAEIIKEQLKAQPQFVLDQAMPILEQLERGEKVEEVPPFLFTIFRPSVQPYIISWFKYNPIVEIAKLEKPIMIIQGTTDIQVGTVDAVLLAAANERSKKEIIEGMNHVLKMAPADRMKNMQTYSDPELPVHDELLEKIVAFINEQLD